MDTTIAQLQDLFARLNTGLVILSIGFIALLVYGALRARLNARNLEQFIVLDGRILTDLPADLRMIPKPPPHPLPMGVAVTVHLAGGRGQARRVDEIVPLRFWRANERQGYINLKTGAQLTDAEQRLIADEIRRRTGEDAWQQRSPQVRQQLGAAD